MPLITLASNVPASRFPSGFNVQFTKLLAEMLGKPASRILLLVTPNAQLSHGPTQDPSCLTVVSLIYWIYWAFFLAYKADALQLNNYDNN